MGWRKLSHSVIVIVMTTLLVLSIRLPFCDFLLSLLNGCFEVAIIAAEVTVACKLFFFLYLDLNCLPSADDVESLCLRRIMPLFVSLCSAGGNDVILNA
jgi:hypothetical protein